MRGKSPNIGEVLFHHKPGLHLCVNKTLGAVVDSFQ